MTMMLVQMVLDSAGGPPLAVHTPVHTTPFGIMPTGLPAEFFINVQDGQLNANYPVKLPVETAEAGLEMLKDQATMEDHIATARREVMKQIQGRQLRQSLMGLPPGARPG